MNKETYVTPSIESIEISSLNMLDVSLGENEIDMNKGDFFN